MSITRPWVKIMKTGDRNCSEPCAKENKQVKAAIRAWPMKENEERRKQIRIIRGTQTDHLVAQQLHSVPNGTEKTASKAFPA